MACASELLKKLPWKFLGQLIDIVQLSASHPCSLSRNAFPGTSSSQIISHSHAERPLSSIDRIPTLTSTELRGPDVQTPPRDFRSGQIPKHVLACPNFLWEARVCEAETQLLALHGAQCVRVPAEFLQSNRDSTIGA
jgi:hypothetical protein